MENIEEEVDVQLKGLLDDYKFEKLTAKQAVELIKVLLIEDVKCVGKS